MTGPLYHVALAALINRAHGGAVIASWEIDELDESTYMLYSEWSAGGQRNTAGLQRIEAAKAGFRRQIMH